MVPCYIHTIKSHDPCADVMVSCKLQDKLVLYYIHIISHNQFPHDNLILSTGKPNRACQCEVTGSSSR